MLVYVSSERATQRILPGHKNMPLVERLAYDRRVHAPAEDKTITYGNSDLRSCPEQPEPSGVTQLI